MWSHRSPPGIPMAPALWPLGEGLVIMQTALYSVGGDMLGAVLLRAVPDQCQTEPKPPVGEAWAVSEASNGPMMTLTFADEAAIDFMVERLTELRQEMERQRHAQSA